MSLINDALKRASTKKVIKVGGAPLQPAQEKQNKHAGVLPVVILLLVLIGAGYGGWLWWQKKNAPAATEAGTKGKTNVTSKATNPIVATKPAGNVLDRVKGTLNKVQERNDQGNAAADTMKSPAAEIKPAPPTSIATERTLSGKPVAAAPALPPAQPAPAPQAVETPDELRLQAIFFRLKNPSAIISGKTVRQDDQINGYKVVAIERQSVKLVDNSGASKVLSLR